MKIIAVKLLMFNLTEFLLVGHVICIVKSMHIQGPKLTFLCERQVATEIFFPVAIWKILVAKKCP